MSWNGWQPIPERVDLVYTWVDGAGPEYQAAMAHYAREPVDLNPERVRDLHDTLRFSLRSVALYAPWVRDVWIVTQRPQAPAWLDLDNPRVQLVHHDDIFEDPSLLPTFNSQAIQSHLHRVPVHSDYLVYMNDDFLFGRQTSLGDFVAPDGRIKVLGTIVGERLPFRIYFKRWRLASLGRIEHHPLFIHRPTWAAGMDARPGPVGRTRRNRFRTGTCVSPDKLYRLDMLRAGGKAMPSWQLLREHRFHKVTNDPPKQRRLLAELEAMRPKHYCLNDDQRDHPDPEVRALVQDFLDRMYAEPSEFERTS